MELNRLFAEHEKIIPFKKILPFLLITFTVGIILILVTIINLKTPNMVFFKTEISGYVFEIERRPRDTFFLIGDSWYLIKTEIIDKISEGDSIVKQQDSYTLNVYDEKARIKWKGEVRSLIFRQVDRPE